MRLEQHMAAAAGALGGVHGSVGVGHELAAFAMAGMDGNAYGAGDLDLLSRELERLGQRGQRSFRDADAGLLVDHVLEQQQEFVAAHARHGIAFARLEPQAVGRAAQYQVAGRVAERVIDGLEAIEVHEQHRQTIDHAFVIGAVQPQQRLAQPVLEQQPVGQAGQGVRKGAVLQFVVGGLEPRIALLQRFGQALGRALQPRVENRGEQRADQQHAGRHHHQHREAGAAELARAQAHRAHEKARRGHAGVMHAADRHGHHPGSGQLVFEPLARMHLAQQLEDQQRRGRRQHRDQHRQRDDERIPDDARRHIHRAHAYVVHAADARAHEQRTERELPVAKMLAAGQLQRHARGRECREPGQQRHSAGKADGNGQRERLHAQEMHGPDPGAHDQRARGPPGKAHAALGAAHPPGKVQRDVGGQHGNEKRRGNHQQVVAGGHERSHTGRNPIGNCRRHCAWQALPWRSGADSMHDGSVGGRCVACRAHASQGNERQKLSHGP